MTPIPAIAAQRAAETALVERITPWTPGNDIMQRIDEIVLSGVTHLEMTTNRTAILWVGSHMFAIRATGKGELVVALVHIDIPAGPVGDAGAG